WLLARTADPLRLQLDDPPPYARRRASSRLGFRCRPRQGGAERARLGYPHRLGRADSAHLGSRAGGALMAGMVTPLRRVRHLGAAHDGTAHFWRQRLTAAANLPLVIAFIILIATLVGRSYTEVVAVLASPFVAILLVLMMISISI